ncbi:MAG: glycosyltransferase family 39 protein [Opitutae bacterium]|nr:glycosyltransferase family 39 protein [Opitutae bacterium]
MITALPPLPAIGRIARACVWGALVYWGIYALVAPVTTIDSQMYNLARLELAMRGGLFDNDYFTSVFHVIFPWTFDAVHLPFLFAGWGYALPSFLCLAGTCYVVQRMMRARFGEDAAWMAVLGLLALPCLVYQAVGTKNDIAMLFAGALWIYARWRWRREKSSWHLVWMALAVGFMTGAKTPGLLYGAVLSLWTLWELRHDRRLSLRFLGGLTGVLLLFGSVETYVESARLFGHPLGPPPLLHRLANHDGVRGGIANFLRHVAGSVYVGPTDFSDGQRAVSRLNDATRWVLAHTGLTDAGTDPRFPDRTLFLTQSGMEELSGFGPLGTLAMAAMLCAGLRWRPKAVWWRLGAAALFGLILTSLTVGYTCWTNRYLISWYALGIIATACALWETNYSWRRSAHWSFLALAAVSAFAAPWLSFNRGPSAVIAALRDRENLETSANPVTGKLREHLRRLKTQSPRSRIILVVTDESTILPLVEDRSLAVIAVTKVIFHRLALRGQLASGDLVVQESPTDSPALALVEEVTAPNVYSYHQTHTRYIYRIVAPFTSAPPISS